ncbi:MAG: AbrB/MazE/SpoVT family DNA-binding domain-containing protein [Beduini sp.]
MYRYLFDTVKVGEMGQIVIPKEAREIFNIKAVDMLDERQGIVAVIGFMVLTLVPLFLILYCFKAEKITYGVISLICFLCTIIFLLYL